MRLVHLTSAHPHDDVRICVKMCKALAAAGHEVHLVVPRTDTVHVEQRDGVAVHPVPVPKTRAERMSKTVKTVLEVGASLCGDVYHFHDPDFLRYALYWQKRLGRPFVYDVHEDYRSAIRDRTWLHPWLRFPLAVYFGLLEDRVAPRLAAVVSATPAIEERFVRHPSSILVQNFPLRNELTADCGSTNKRTGLFIYVGGISPERGAREMARAVGIAGCPAVLALAGRFESDALAAECVALGGGNSLKKCGFLDRTGVRDLMREAMAGLVLFHPMHNHVRSQPNKLFEYMSAGLPVIASDFPLWRAIVDGSRCGLLVDPLSPQAIADGMRWIMDHPTEAKEMGERGRNAVIQVYNWEAEFPKLLDLYARLHISTEEKQELCSSG